MPGTFGAPGETFGAVGGTFGDLSGAGPGPATANWRRFAASSTATAVEGSSTITTFEGGPA